MWLSDHGVSRPGVARTDYTELTGHAVLSGNGELTHPAGMDLAPAFAEWTLQMRDLQNDQQALTHVRSHNNLRISTNAAVLCCEMWLRSPCTLAAHGALCQVWSVGTDILANPLTGSQQT